MARSRDVLKRGLGSSGRQEGRKAGGKAGRHQVDRRSSYGASMQPGELSTNYIVRAAQDFFYTPNTSDVVRVSAALHRRLLHFTGVPPHFAACLLSQCALPRRTIRLHLPGSALSNASRLPALQDQLVARMMRLNPGRSMDASRVLSFSTPEEANAWLRVSGNTERVLGGVHFSPRQPGVWLLTGGGRAGPAAALALQWNGQEQGRHLGKNAGRQPLVPICCPIVCCSTPWRCRRV